MGVDEVFGFPPELEREIFETAALQHASTIPALLRVCRRVHVWVEPLLYRILVIQRDSAPILASVQSKPSPFLRLAVRHLFISPRVADTANIILSCSDIHSLFLDGTFDAKLLDILDQMRVRRLNLSLPSSLSGWPKATLTRPTFLRLTHLELFKTARSQSAHLSWHDWSPLASLPALTHLCLSGSISSHLLSDIVAECAQLLVVATAWWDMTEGAERASRFAQSLTFTDPRVVVMAIDNYTDDWKLGAEGGADFWVRAESFLARKRKGEIPPTIFFLDGGVPLDD
ncbi:hypothetical protein C8R46DRAFT_437716 [Mycena filopes]|nr:hypothetical protein C8R46DRAFT_437716 [Mycena filopes]